MDLKGQVLPYGSPIPVGAYNYSLAPAPLPQQDQGQPGQPQPGQPQPGQQPAAAPSPLSPQQMAQMMQPQPMGGLAAMPARAAMMPRMAGGGNTSEEEENAYVGSAPKTGSLRAGLTKPRLQYILAGLPDSRVDMEKHAEGGEVGHKPQFFSEGGLQSMENRYVKGEGDGTSDSIPAMLADGEFVIPADVVSSLGNGSNQAGSKVLDEFLRTIREHKRKADAKHLPPDSKGPLGYLTDAKRKVKK